MSSFTHTHTHPHKHIKTYRDVSPKWVNFRKEIPKHGFHENPWTWVHVFCRKKTHGHRWPIWLMCLFVNLSAVDCTASILKTDLKWINSKHVSPYIRGSTNARKIGNLPYYYPPSSVLARLFNKLLGRVNEFGLECGLQIRGTNHFDEQWSMSLQKK